MSVEIKSCDTCKYDDFSSESNKKCIDCVCFSGYVKRVEDDDEDEI